MINYKFDAQELFSGDYPENYNIEQSCKNFTRALTKALKQEFPNENISVGQGTIEFFSDNERANEIAEEVYAGYEWAVENQS